MTTVEPSYKKDMKYGDDKDFESPPDVYLFHPLASQTLHLYKQAGLTPNNVTTLSLICSLLSVYYLYKRQYSTAAILYILNYYFDCVDGRLARRYNMKSDIGEAYDALSDNIAVAVLFITMLYLIKDEYIWYLIGLAVIVSVVLNYWYVSNEMHAKGPNYASNVMSRLKDLPINRLYEKFTKSTYNMYLSTREYIPEVIKKNIKYFGSGTANIVIATLMYNFDSIRM